MLLSQLGFVLIGFLSGSVLFSYHSPMWLKHIDVVKESKDHNPGTSNAFKYAGVNIGILCLLADLAKSFLPVFYSVHCLGFPYALLPLVMAAPVAGHAFSPWYGFHGGKAIAASFGALLGLVPHTGAVLVLAFWYILFSTLIAIHPNERRTVIAFGCTALTCAAACLITRSFALLPGYLMIAAIPIYRNNEAPVEPDNASAAEQADEAPLPQEKT